MVGLENECVHTHQQFHCSLNCERLVMVKWWLYSLDDVSNTLTMSFILLRLQAETLDILLLRPSEVPVDIAVTQNREND